jgi:hypothetical protein
MRILVTLFAAAMLVGCQSKVADAFDSRQNAGPCPPAGSVYDVARYVSFKDGSEELYTNIEYTGEITDVRMFCRYADDDPLVAEMEIDFAFGKGEAAKAGEHVYPYFVAVTRRNGKVLAKEHFAIKGNFAGGKRLDGQTAKLMRIKIPRLDESVSGSNFEILVGFDLTAEQLAFNRAGKRYRLDAEH